MMPSSVFLTLSADIIIWWDCFAATHTDNRRAQSQVCPWGRYPALRLTSAWAIFPRQLKLLRCSIYIIIGRTQVSRPNCT